ncbi:related to nuclear migration protein ami1 [Cephalotrichum gorgonifer]|uniref:Related to nuclear migration protein ami1 n=1 Tax=Cephalotrichum gorgonifer TaxID=2041049 RepID=A0AAE8MQ38_9PEZI|nr:related to nuclear migration protein ami1 [Cephalotrichum gorgonifer]
MAVWETEDESNGPTAAASLPTPQETPYRTPSRGSRRSRRSATPPGKGSSPAPSDKRSSKDVTIDESISILDPRRFTPTLHASLVSEILALRRDQEDRTKLIESLEDSLHESREEQETLQADLSAATKESRSLKRQIALLEGGSSSALGELSRERDDAVDSAAEVRKRLDATQKKLRLQEDDSQRVHDLWAKEKDEWEEERRKYERRIHVTETRLKVVLDEVAAYHAAQANGAQSGVPESDTEEPQKDNDAASIRTMSMTNSVRFSVMSGLQAAKMNGNSLADELNFDGDDDWQTDDGGRESVLSNHHHHVRKMSRDSVMSRMHRRNLSMESQARPGSVARGKLWANHAVLETLEDGIGEDTEIPEPAPKPIYTDTGIQYSPPPSPKLQPSKPSTPEPMVRLDRGLDIDSPSRGSPRGDSEIEANQRRKRVHPGRPLAIDPIKPPRVMVSASSQTTMEPLSPPKTPKTPPQPTTPPPPVPVFKPRSTACSSTQTDPAPLPRPETFPMPSMSIPSISIVPPTSRPTTPREPRLPQYFKDFGCQVNLPPSVDTASVSVQTEEIRIDKRIALLPEHLRPSAITSRPPTPNSPVEEGRQFTPVPGNLPPRNPRRLAGRSLTEIPSSPPRAPHGDEVTHDAYPGNNDNGPLSTHRAPVKRPHRISSLFAGFDGSSDEAEEFGEGDVSDSEFRTALSAPHPKGTVSPRPSKRNSAGTLDSMSPEQATSSRGTSSRNSVRPIGGTDMYGSHHMPEVREVVTRRPSLKRSLRSYEKTAVVGTASKVSVMRRAAMIQSGIASHQGRARSPSLSDVRDPPFPIPTRASSRRPPFSASAPSDGQRSPTRQGESWNRHGVGRSHYRANSIRKVRSAAAIPVKPRSRRQGSRSPPPLSPSTGTFESPGLPPLPNNDITTPRTRAGSSVRYKAHQSQPSTNTAFTANTDVASSSSQPLGVVDAIAQTMVGEWMFKYVRRRKSFGVPESGGKDENSNDRHKRWVWLAPYERAILWSSKQPSSNSTLMGKSGRKFTIQSVLDVKDDNASPKGVPPLFNRSILILTPQRALKFTAVSAERHYVWLTALSFLAHSSQAIPDISVVQPPKPVPDFEPPRAKTRRPGIRDSIRLTKSKGNYGKPTSTLPPIPNVLSAPIADIPTLRAGEEPFPALPSGAGHHRRESSHDPAQPPVIPRFHERHFQERGAQERANNVMVHGRKRSNTGGHVPPPLSFRGFSGPAGGQGYSHTTNNSVAGASVGTAGSSDIYQQSQQSGPSSSAAWALSTTASVRTSEASSRPSPSNFFDAIGTVRMEAFITPLAHPRLDDYPDEHDEFRNFARRRSKELRRRNSRNRNRDSYTSRATRTTERTTDEWSRTDDDFFARDDPFRGF